MGWQSSRRSVAPHIDTSGRTRSTVPGLSRNASVPGGRVSRPPERRFRASNRIEPVRSLPRSCLPSAPSRPSSIALRRWFGSPTSCVHGVPPNASSRPYPKAAQRGLGSKRGSSICGRCTTFCSFNAVGPSGSRRGQQRGRPDPLDDHPILETNNRAPPVQPAFAAGRNRLNPARSKTYLSDAVALARSAVNGGADPDPHR